jgi:hypothetical protein
MGCGMGANDATVLRTSGDLDFRGLRFAKGEHSLFVWVDARQQTGSRVPMSMSRPPKPVETFRITLAKTSGASGQLQMAWENSPAAVEFTVVGRS